MAQRQHLGSCKSIWTEKGKKWTSQGRRLRNLPYNPSRETVAEDDGLSFTSTTMCLTGCMEVVLLGADALVA